MFDVDILSRSLLLQFVVGPLSHASATAAFGSADVITSMLFCSKIFTASITVVVAVRSIVTTAKTTTGSTQSRNVWC